MPVYHEAGGEHRALVTDGTRSHPLSTEDAVSRWHDAGGATTGILPFALRASLRLFKIAPSDFVEPLDFMARLAALVPTPRANLTRYYGAINMNWRTESSLA